MILAATGHRPEKLGGYSTEVRDRLLQFAMAQLAQLRPDMVISGMAQGWDLAIAQAAALSKIPFRAYIPFVGQESVWPEANQRLYQAMLKRAERVVVCCVGGYEAWKMQERNVHMVDDCELLLALWDGSTGGTANCVRYAHEVDREVLNVWGRWQRFRAG